MDTIFVFSHLRWDFVYQRPQHLLSRLARHYRIFCFEEPLCSDAPRLEISEPIPNLTICKPYTPVKQAGFVDEQLACLRPMVRQLASRHEVSVAWFYTPMPLPLLQDLGAARVVYDCMDELSAFRNPPPHLVQREAELLGMANLVFTGGPSLYQAKRHRNPNVHCFPSSVDASHFRQALNRNIAHPAYRQLSGPRLGFYGVIDERFDSALVARLADARPEWQIMLVGPVVKIDPASLPQRPNIHYTGQQPYSALPQFLASWDVCLMPFAMNESTRFISPTKSLEYMAAELPIVSTPVRDVADLHGDVVEIAADPDAFIGACERMLNLPDDERRQRIRLMRNKLAQTSWDMTASRMHALLESMGADSAEKAAEAEIAGQVLVAEKHASALHLSANQ